jgi:hypothetical protein
MSDWEHDLAVQDALGISTADKPPPGMSYIGALQEKIDALRHQVKVLESQQLQGALERLREKVRTLEIEREWQDLSR